ncbi:hypothetical protein [Leuconostoc citreum]
MLTTIGILFEYDFNGIILIFLQETQKLIFTEEDTVLTNPKYWGWIPWSLANGLPILFVYYFVTPWVKNTMGLAINSLLKSANITDSTIEPILWVFLWSMVITVIGLLLYYLWQRYDFSIDKYGGQLLINITVSLLIFIFFGLFIMNSNSLVFIIQKILISTLLWKMLTLTATYLTKKDINNSILTSNLIKIIPILISIFALLNSYYH